MKTPKIIVLEIESGKVDGRPQSVIYFFFYENLTYKAEEDIVLDGGFGFTSVDSQCLSRDPTSSWFVSSRISSTVIG